MASQLARQLGPRGGGIGEGGIPYSIYKNMLYRLDKSRSALADARLKTVFSCMFGSMIFQTHRASEHFTTVVARISSSLVRSLVILVVSLDGKTLCCTGHRNTSIVLCVAGCVVEILVLM